MAVELLTVGHGARTAEELASLLNGAAVDLVLDIRRYPSSRRHPQFDRGALECWLPERGLSYRWEERLGGRRPPARESPNHGLTNASFRAYADYMASAEFVVGMETLLGVAAARRTAVLCAESLWWRCHRRLVADAATLLHGSTVTHLLPDCRDQAHQPTPCARRDGATLTYPPAQGTLPVSGEAHPGPDR
jgi:uncharacterized protein (DUF488 family)